MTETWINETLYPAWGQRFQVRRELARVRSDFQEILLFDSETHGRVLLLDGVIQITERDEFVYQEMLAHVPLLIHPEPRSVLIIGGGDGGVLRRVLEHATVSRAVMVEIDAEVIRLSQEFLPKIAGNAWKDPRTRLVVGDGIAFVREAQDASVDVIIVDSTDPAGVGEVLFTDDFYQNCARVLTPDGLIVNQCGVPFMQPEELQHTSARRARFFPNVSAYVVAVPTYVGGFMALGIAGKGNALIDRPDIVTTKSRATRAGILGHTRYWTPEVQANAFDLPPYIAEHLPPQ